MFALGSLRDLPDLDALDAAGMRDADGGVEAALDDALGLLEKEAAEAEDGAFDDTEVEA
jgi:hypothetical protein